MFGKCKKVLIIMLTVLMCIVSFTASAAQWHIKDYGLDFVQYDANGLPIIRKNVPWGEEKIICGYDSFIKDPWFDISFPNKEYGTLYVEGVNTNIFKPTDRAGQVFSNNEWIKTGIIEYKDADFKWDVVAPFGIYSIVKAKLNINGIVQWYGTPEYGYPVKYTGRNADVKANKVSYGFGDFQIVGPDEIRLIPDDLDGVHNNFGPVSDNNDGTISSYINPDIYNISGLEIAAGGVASLSPVTTEDGSFSEFYVPQVQILDDKYSLNIHIPRSYEYALVGPSFDELGNQTPYGLTICSSSYCEGKRGGRAAELASFGVQDLIDIERDLSGSVELCDITWTTGGYELVSPYRVYNYLTIDGVVMDGRYIGESNGKHYWRPYIITYTAFASDR